MLGFLSERKQPRAVVKKKRISFVSVPSGKSEDEIKMLLSPKAKLFADTLNLKVVYLHYGEENIIKYDYTV